ncbi:hypothetical protein BDV93DRAFT_563711 [Ceratobasidium sp. AG-I]|nr:hypothetical protein BDV93DRAFT_563711 [Ceratobasidium sp. AG-I]
MVAGLVNEEPKEEYVPTPTTARQTSLHTPLTVTTRTAYMSTPSSSYNDTPIITVPMSTMISSCQQFWLHALMCKDVFDERKNKLEEMVRAIGSPGLANKEPKEADPSWQPPMRTPMWFVMEVLRCSLASIHVLHIALAYLAGAKLEIHTNFVLPQIARRSLHCNLLVCRSDKVATWDSHLTP